MIIMVQVADLSHENFKSSRITRWWLCRLSSRFWCQVKLWTQNQVTPRTSKSKKLFSFRGASPPDPLTRGSAPGPRWGLCPQTPVIGSRSRARHKRPPLTPHFSLPSAAPNRSTEHPLANVGWTVISRQATVTTDHPHGDAPAGSACTSMMLFIIRVSQSVPMCNTGSQTCRNHTCICTTM